MGRAAALVYGVLAYLVFLAAFLYAVGFVANFVVPKSIDSGVVEPSGRSILIDVVLLGLFAVQHSVMARPPFKRWWTKLVPEHVERSTYVLLSSLLLLLVMWQWRPLPDVIWNVAGAAASLLWVVFAAGWGIVLVSTFLIDHFDLFGLRQVFLHARGTSYSRPRFVERSFYRFVRHPLMLGFLIAFWATPRMSTGHLLFAITTTAYILVAIHIEERDLTAAHGEEYSDYKRRVSMLVPIPGKGKVPAS